MVNMYLVTPWGERRGESLFWDESKIPENKRFLNNLRNYLYKHGYGVGTLKLITEKGVQS